MALTKHQMNHEQLKGYLNASAEEAENGNRHDFAGALWDLIDHVDELPLGYGFFGVFDFDALGNDRFAYIELVDYGF